MQTERKLLNSKEAADYLGLSISYFRKLMMKRELPMYKPNGKLCFFDTDDLDAYIRSVRISSKDETERKTAQFQTNNINPTKN